ncbi:MAG: hypothetical protein EOP83_17200 [Verrucomicrobiaceae bacterium]|nr:MAG: hypothetical protein EOP83_17200 [Verrucomicrobiaceae bacterium]
MTEIKHRIIEDFDHRVGLAKEWYRSDGTGFQPGWPNARTQVLGWCRDRFGAPALGHAVNRDDPRFYRNDMMHIDPDFARFEYDASAAWVSRNVMFWFRSEDAAFEFKMRWRGVRSVG